MTTTAQRGSVGGVGKMRAITASSPSSNRTGLAFTSTDDSNSVYEQAAKAIINADFILISAGAGFSADSGLAVYKDIANVPAYHKMKVTYSDLCDPIWITKDPDIFFGFWGSCLNQYRDTTPHEGYTILKRWRDTLPPPPQQQQQQPSPAAIGSSGKQQQQQQQQQKRLNSTTTTATSGALRSRPTTSVGPLPPSRRTHSSSTTTSSSSRLSSATSTAKSTNNKRSAVLPSLSSSPPAEGGSGEANNDINKPCNSNNKRFFVFTSNVDCAFTRTGFSEQEVYEIHGNIDTWQCSKPCSMYTWKIPADNDVEGEEGQRFRFHVDTETMRCPPIKYVLASATTATMAPTTTNVNRPPPLALASFTPLINLSVTAGTSASASASATGTPTVVPKPARRIIILDTTTTTTTTSNQPKNPSIPPPIQPLPPPTDGGSGSSSDNSISTEEDEEDGEDEEVGYYEGMRSKTATIRMNNNNNNNSNNRTATTSSTASYYLHRLSLLDTTSVSSLSPTSPSFSSSSTARSGSTTTRFPRYYFPTPRTSSSLTARSNGGYGDGYIAINNSSRPYTSPSSSSATTSSAIPSSITTTITGSTIISNLMYSIQEAHRRVLFGSASDRSTQQRHHHSELDAGGGVFEVTLVDPHLTMDHSQLYRSRHQSQYPRRTRPPLPHRRQLFNISLVIKDCLSGEVRFQAHDLSSSSLPWADQTSSNSNNGPIVVTLKTQRRRIDGKRIQTLCIDLSGKQLQNSSSGAQDASPLLPIIFPLQSHISIVVVEQQTTAGAIHQQQQQKGEKEEQRLCCCWQIHGKSNIISSSVASNQKRSFVLEHVLRTLELPSSTSSGRAGGNTTTAMSDYLVRMRTSQVARDVHHLTHINIEMPVNGNNSISGDLDEEEDNDDDDDDDLIVDEDLEQEEYRYSSRNRNTVLEGNNSNSNTRNDTTRAESQQQQQQPQRKIVPVPNHIYCSKCRAIARPNILMFDDNAWINATEPEERYEAWEKMVKKALKSNNNNGGGNKKRLVILEIGCGIRVPTVRENSERLLKQALKHGGPGSATLIRINPDYPNCDSKPPSTATTASSSTRRRLSLSAGSVRGTSSHSSVLSVHDATISIRDTGLAAVKKIDEIIKRFI